MSKITFSLTISTELNDWLKAQSEIEKRSKNQHIAMLLELEMRQVSNRRFPLQEEKWEGMKDGT